VHGSALQNKECFVLRRRTICRTLTFFDRTCGRTLAHRLLIRKLRPLLLLLCGIPVVAQIAPPDPGPFLLSQRFAQYMHRTYSWQRMAWLGFDSVFDCATGGTPGFSELLHGYGDGFGRRIVANSTEFAAGALLHEDARYQGLYTGGYRRRLRHATVRAFQASVPGSHYRPAYSRFAAMAAGELVPSLWSSHGISPSDAIFGMGFGILDQMQNNYLTEFTPELKNFGRKVGRKLQGLVRPRGVTVSNSTLVPAVRK
jgi:hypothetical protein